MDNYKKLMCVKGLIMSMDEQIYRIDTVRKDRQDEHTYKMIVDKYYDAIVNFLNEKGDNERA